MSEAENRLHTLEREFNEQKETPKETFDFSKQPSHIPPEPKRAETEPFSDEDLGTGGKETPYSEEVAFSEPGPPVALGPPEGSAPPTTPDTAGSIDWEQFLGVRLFAWIGGLVLFLGVAFFVKYSFENGLISPQLRVTIGYLTGIGLIVCALFIPRGRHAATVETFCATGTLILYGSIFASHSFYRFIGPSIAFALMALVTATAFVLAVRLNAQVVAVLGLLGGFLTPPLLSTGVDRPWALFAYIALLDAGLLAVALRKGWPHLVLLAGAATAVMQAGWVLEFFSAAKIYTAYIIFVGFAALFVATLFIGNRLKRSNRWIDAAAILITSVGFIFVLYLLVYPYPVVARKAAALFGFLFLIDIGVLGMAMLRDNLRFAQAVAGGGAFLLLAIWTSDFISPALLNTALCLYLLFALLHSCSPILLQRVRPVPTTYWWIHLWPVLGILLTLFPIFRLPSLSFLIWPAILLIDLLAVVLALLTAKLASILVVFLLTMLATAAHIMRMPPFVPELNAVLTVTWGFALFFAAAAILLGRKYFSREGVPDSKVDLRPLPPMPPRRLVQISSLASIMPFLLLTMAELRLPLSNPSPVFGLGALLLLLLLGFERFYRIGTLSAVGLGSVLMMEYAWEFRGLAPTSIGAALPWYLGFSAAFLIFPFLFRRRMEDRLAPWIVSAVSFPAHFLLIYHALLTAYPQCGFFGILPALLALPCLMGLRQLIRNIPEANPRRNDFLALFGGAALFFITLIFPIQFEREWLTIGWALEGAALLWLYRRLPHPGLRLTGVILLGAAFVRLAMNSAVLSYHERSGARILNWFLYAYGIGAACMMAGARLLAPPRHLIRDVNTPPVLYGLGTILAFLLVNIEIADYFSGGNHLTFQFSGNFAQDMSYSLAWGLFALILMSVGFRFRNAAVRYSGMGLLVVTIIKLFLHDLWRLGGLYRVGSLVGLAMVLMVVSFVYQRFLSSADGTNKSYAADK